MDNTPETKETTPETTSSVPEVTPVAPAETPVVSVVETIVTTPSAVATLPSATPLYKNKHMLIALAVALALILGAGYYAYMMSTTGGTVAVVNGKKITQKEFNENISLIEQAATAQGADITKTDVQKEIHDQALTVLVNNALLITAALDEKITVSDDEVKVKYDELIAQLGSEDELKKRMVEVGLTEEKLQNNINERILFDKYIESKTDMSALTVTDEEIRAFIETINTGDAKLPPLEEIKPQIEAQLLSQKKQQVVDDIIATLRGEAEIDIKI